MRCLVRKKALSLCLVSSSLTHLPPRQLLLIQPLKYLHWTAWSVSLFVSLLFQNQVKLNHFTSPVTHDAATYLRFPIASFDFPWIVYKTNFLWKSFKHLKKHVFRAFIAWWKPKAGEFESKSEGIALHSAMKSRWMFCFLAFIKLFSDSTKRKTIYKGRMYIFISFMKL